MNDLTTQNPAASETWTQLSPGLKSLLTLGDRTSAIREMSRNPVMLVEARQSLAALRNDATRPAGLEGVKRVVGRRLAVFPPMSMSDGAWAAWWQDYTDVLGDLPEQALEAGMKAWLRSPNADFLPKPGKLRQLAQQAGTMAITAYDRAKAAIASGESDAVRERVPKERVDAILQGYRAQAAARKEAAQRPPPPASHGDGDARGLTSQMRAVLQARGAE